MPPSALPLGEPIPEDGALPESCRDGVASRAFGVYLHVPFCRVRCGYCDFNTYTATELRGVSQASYPDEVAKEVALAHRVMGDAGVLREAATVFVGGGTPTLLPSGELARMLGMVRDTFGFESGAEVTVEANPDTVGPRELEELAAAGVTRLSIGMQSAVPHVLRTLGRTHDPDRIAPVVRAAKQAGLETSLDLIYGAPGESLADWEHSLQVALEQEPHHISAYALIVEDGTKLARQIARGEVAAPDDDLQASMYELADERLAEAGFEWYEISNWSRGGAHPSRHNLNYWLGADWWGFGPGAHSHIGGVRFWNAKHPAAYAERLVRGVTPAVGREVLDESTRRTERILLETRIRQGLPVEVLPDRTPLAGLIADGLVDGRDALRGRVVPTLGGRLLADRIVTALDR